MSDMEAKKIAIKINLPEDEFDLLLSLRHCDEECKDLTFHSGNIRVRDAATGLAFKGLAHIFTIDSNIGVDDFEVRISKSGRWLLDKGSSKY